MLVNGNSQLTMFTYTKTSNMDLTWSIDNFVYETYTNVNSMRCMLVCSNLRQCSIVSYDRELKTCKIYLMSTTGMTFDSDNTDLFAKTPAISCMTIKNIQA